MRKANNMNNFKEITASILSMKNKYIIQICLVDISLIKTISHFTHEILTNNISSSVNRFAELLLNLSFSNTMKWIISIRNGKSLSK